MDVIEINAHMMVWAMRKKGNTTAAARKNNDNNNNNIDINSVAVRHRFEYKASKLRQFEITRRYGKRIIL